MPFLPPGLVPASELSSRWDPTHPSTAEPQRMTTRPRKDGSRRVRGGDGNDALERRSRAQGGAAGSGGSVRGGSPRLAWVVQGARDVTIPSTSVIIQVTLVSGPNLASPRWRVNLPFWKLVPIANWTSARKTTAHLARQPARIRRVASQHRKTRYGRRTSALRLARSMVLVVWSGSAQPVDVRAAAGEPWLRAGWGLTPGERDWGTGSAVGGPMLVGEGWTRGEVILRPHNWKRTRASVFRKGKEIGAICEARAACEVPAPFPPSFSFFSFSRREKERKGI